MLRQQAANALCSNGSSGAGVRRHFNNLLSLFCLSSASLRSLPFFPISPYLISYMILASLPPHLDSLHTLSEEEEKALDLFCYIYLLSAPLTTHQTFHLPHIPFTTAFCHVPCHCAFHLDTPVLYYHFTACPPTYPPSPYLPYHSWFEQFLTLPSLPAFSHLSTTHISFLPFYFMTRPWLVLHTLWPHRPHTPPSHARVAG